jgi:hypothetical protein
VKPAQRAKGRALIALLLGVAAAAALLFAWMPPETLSGGVPARAAALPPPAAPAAVALPQAHAAAQRSPEGDADPTRDLSSYVARGENPSMAQVIDGLHQRGVYSGLGAFQPPGTSPPLEGLAVPEDFPLPRGYVRHHQSTDDGQPIEAILMFAPGYQMVDANGQPVPMPENRVVPPGLAPPGLAIRRITIPPPIDTAR